MARTSEHGNNVLTCINVGNFMASQGLFDGVVKGAVRNVCVLVL